MRLLQLDRTLSFNGDIAELEVDGLPPCIRQRVTVLPWWEM
jgi:hypothetical protein